MGPGMQCCPRHCHISELQGKRSAKTCSVMGGLYEHLTRKVIISLWKRRLLLNHLMKTWMILYIGYIKEKDWLEENLSMALYKTNIGEFASFLEPNSNAFHGLFSFNKIVTIPDTWAAFLI